MTQEERNGVIEKIIKLTNLANNSAATPDEAAAAASRAQALMFKYNLDMAQVETAQVGMDITKDWFDMGAHGANRFTITFHRELMHTIARNNFCKYLQSTGSNRIVLVGKPHDIEMAKYLYGYLSREIIQLAAKAVKLHCDAVDPGPRGSWVLSYSRGAVRTIGNMLYAQRKADVAAHTGGSALVLATEQALAEALSRFFPKTGKAQGTDSPDSRAALLGARDARNISINKPVAEHRSNSQKALGN